MYKYIKAADTASEVDENGVLYTMAETISRRQYYHRDDIITLVAPNCIKIEDEAFAGCNRLNFANIPKAKEIGDEAFEDCINLQAVDCYDVEKIWDYAFAGCYNLRSVEEHDVVYVDNTAFLRTPLEEWSSKIRSVLKVTHSEYELNK